MVIHAGNPRAQQQAGWCHTKENRTNNHNNTIANDTMVIYRNSNMSFQQLCMWWPKERYLWVSLVMGKVCVSQMHRNHTQKLAKDTCIHWGEIHPRISISPASWGQNCSSSTKSTASNWSFREVATRFSVSDQRGPAVTWRKHPCLPVLAFLLHNPTSDFGTQDLRTCWQMSAVTRRFCLLYRTLG